MKAKRNLRTKADRDWWNSIDKAASEAPRLIEIKLKEEVMSDYREEAEALARKNEGVKVPLLRPDRARNIQQALQKVAQDQFDKDNKRCIQVEQKAYLKGRAEALQECYDLSISNIKNDLSEEAGRLAVAAAILRRLNERNCIRNKD